MPSSRLGGKQLPVFGRRCEGLHYKGGVVGQDETGGIATRYLLTSHPKSISFHNVDGFNSPEIRNGKHKMEQWRCRVSIPVLLAC